VVKASACTRKTQQMPITTVWLAVSQESPSQIWRSAGKSKWCLHSLIFSIVSITDTYNALFYLESREMLNCSLIVSHCLSRKRWRHGKRSKRPRSAQVRSSILRGATRIRFRRKSLTFKWISRHRRWVVKTTTSSRSRGRTRSARSRRLFTFQRGKKPSRPRQ